MDWEDEDIRASLSLPVDRPALNASTEVLGLHLLGLLDSLELRLLFSHGSPFVLFSEKVFSLLLLLVSLDDGLFKLFHNKRVHILQVFCDSH